MQPLPQDTQSNESSVANKDIPKTSGENRTPSVRQQPKILPVTVTVARLVNDDGMALMDWELNFDMGGSIEKETGYLIIDLAKPTSVRLVKSGNRPAFVAVMSSSEPLVEISLAGAKDRDYAYGKLMHRLMFQQIGKARIDYFATRYPHLKYQPADPIMITNQKPDDKTLPPGSHQLGEKRPVIDTNSSTKLKGGKRAAALVLGSIVLMAIVAFVLAAIKNAAHSPMVEQPQVQITPPPIPAVAPKAEDNKPWVPGQN